ncbi:MAG TPA: type II secretion system secretin GspD, partial [Myxococcota bacterium]
QYADAQALAEQLSEVFGGEVSASTGTTAPRQRVQPRVRRGVQPPQAEPVGSARSRLRIITDARTNALIILAARSTLDEIRALIRKLDVPVEGQGRIQVYYLKHADAEELADTLNTLLGAAPAATTTASAAVAAGLQPQQLRSVSEIANLVSSVTADVGTNSLVIQASPEGFEALRKVIEQLDIERPQVLVEALIMEVGVTDSRDLGLSWLVRAAGPDVGFTISQALDSATGGLLGNATRNQKGDTLGPSTGELPFGINIAYLDGDNVIQAVLRATASDNEANIIAAPHILTSDNEEAEILIGDNIPIITNRVQSAQGIVTDPGQDSSLATSVNVERQDIGVTLRVTPQITEGDSLRLEIFQEITDFNDALTEAAGFDPNQTGPALSNRRVENVVVAKDGSTVVIGGLIRDRYSDNTTKVPWLGDIPVLGWLFKSSSTSLQKTNLLIFLTPHIIRSPADLEKASIGKREEFRRRSQQQLAGADERDREVQIVERPIGILAEADTERDRGPAASALKVLERHYPLERMRAIEREQAEQREAARQAAARGARGGRYVVLAGRYSDPEEARATLTELVDAGYDGSLLSSGPAGQVRYELRIGPYEELDQAERAANTLQRAYGLSAQIVVERREGPP